MTQEEAVNILKQVISWRHDNLRGHPEMKYVAEAIDLIMSSLHSLPSNLDEAAFEYENTLWEDGCKDCGYSPLEVFDAFKAGAEWMAGQGYTREYTVDRTPLNGPAGICMNLHDSTGFKIGDKVIVQIRNK